MKRWVYRIFLLGCIVLMLGIGFPAAYTQGVDSIQIFEFIVCYVGAAIIYWKPWHGSMLGFVAVVVGFVDFALDLLRGATSWNVFSDLEFVAIFLIEISAAPILWAAAYILESNREHYVVKS